MPMKIAWLAAVTIAFGCGKAPAQLGDDGPPDASTDGATATGDGGSDDFTMLISRSWSLAADGEKYECRRIMVTQDMWVDAFRVLAPVGTHHSVLTISTNSTMLGDYDCSASNLDYEMLYAAGVDTDDLVFPQGVAVHLTAGQYINLNLHLFNATDNDITNAESGVLVKTIPAASVVHEADMTFAGTFNIDIPDDNQPHTAVGGCQAPSDWHIFTLWPHMHQTAIHQSLTVTHGTTPVTMLDVDYSFFNQRNYPMADTLIHGGDQISVTCTYQNNTAVTDPPGHVMTFGDSSTDEMCFTGMYKYPAGGNLFQCAPM
jgi:hypothetical protein